MSHNESVADIELSIVMPCLNESVTLAGCIEEASQFLTRNNLSGEILIGDNGSTDGSQSIATSLGARVVDVPERGYGAAILGASRAARGKYIIMGDSDGSYDFSNLNPFLTQLRLGHDLVMGNRFKGGIQFGAMPWKNRWIGNPALTGIGRLLFRSPIGDFHCGIRGFSRKLIDKIEFKTSGMEFASEMVVRATLAKLRIAEVPTILRPDKRNRPPHLRPWRDGWRHLRFMLIYSPRWLFFIPGSLLFGTGAVLSTILITGVFYVNRMGFDVASLVYTVSLMLLGYQVIIFALFSKAFGISEGLLPPDPKFKKVLSYTSLEAGLVAGVGLLLLGFAGSIAGVLYWKSKSFGELDPRMNLRIVIPSAVFLILGFQTIFSSFLLSMMQLKLQKD